MIFSKKKVEDLISFLNGLTTAAALFDELTDYSKKFK